MVKIKKNVWCILTPMPGSLSLAIDTRYNVRNIVLDEFYSVIFICLTPFSQLKFGLSNSILNHPGHATLTTWIFLKFLPVVGIIEIWKSWKYYPLTPRGSEFMAFSKNDKLMMIVGAAKYKNFLDNFCLK